MKNTRTEFLKLAKDGTAELTLKSISETEKGFRALIHTGDTLGSGIQTYYESKSEDFITAVREMEDKAIQEYFGGQADLPFFETKTEVLPAETSIEKKLKTKKKKTASKKAPKKAPKIEGVMFDRSIAEHKQIATGLLCELFGEEWTKDKEKISRIREFNDKIEGKEIILLDDGSVASTFKQLYINEFSEIL